MAERLQTYRFTVDEYHKMGEVGIFDEGSRVELIGGQIIVMRPIGDPHMDCVNMYTDVLTSIPGKTWFVSVQNPIRLPPDSEPQPDLVLIKREYAGGAPTAADILVVIEVSDTTLRFDRRIKVPLYAAAGVREVWITEFKGQRVICFGELRDGEYQLVTQVRRGERLTSRYEPMIALDTSEIFRYT